MNSSLEKQLILRAANDNCPQAFAALVRQYQNRLRQYLRQLCYFDPDFADDLAQETFIKAFNSLGQFSFQGSFAGWLFKIGYNTYAGAIRRKKDFNNQSFEDYHAGFTCMDQTESQLTLDKLMTQLSASEKEIMLLFYQQGFSQQEIADILGRPLGTVKSQLLRSKEKLQQFYYANEDDYGQSA